MKKNWYVWYYSPAGKKEYQVCSNKNTARKIAWEYAKIGKYIGMYLK